MSGIALSEFAEKMSVLMPSLAREFSRRHGDELSRGKLTLPQFLILDLLVREHESTMTALARSMNVSTAAMTGSVDRLVREGYVARSADSRDRRIIRVGVTDKGARLARRISARRQEMVTRVFGKISGEDRAAYLRILSRIHRILSQEE